MVNSLKPKIASIVPDQIPEHVNQTGEKFVKFVEDYYKWMNSGNAPSAFLANIMEQHDYDLADPEFKTIIERGIIDILPTAIQIDKGLLIKNIRDFFRSKGSEASYQFLLNALFNEEIDMVWGKNLYGKTSDSKIEHQNIVVLRKPELQATASITRGQISTINILKSDYGFFEKPTVTVVRNDTNTVTIPDIQYKLTGNVVSAHVINGGYGYTSATVTTNSPPAPGVAATFTPIIIDGIISSITVNTLGSGYTELPTLSIVGDGVGATGYVKWTATMHPDITIGPGGGGLGFKVPPIIEFVGGTGTDVSDNINFVSESSLTDSGNIGNDVTVGSPAMVATTINNAGTITAVTLINAGSNYQYKPSIRIQSIPEKDAILDVVMEGSKVIEINILDPGEGYKTEPTLVFSLPENSYYDLDDESNKIFSKLKGNRIEQLGDNYATGIIDTYSSYEIDGDEYFVVELQNSGLKGAFIPESIIKGSSSEGSFVGVVCPILSDISIYETGSMYRKGDRISFDTEEGTTARAIVNDVTRGSVTDTIITKHGKDYRVGDKLIGMKEGIDGLNFEGVVSAVDGYGAEAEVTMELDSVIINDGGFGYSVGDVIHVVPGSRMVSDLNSKESAIELKVLSLESSDDFNGFDIIKTGSGYQACSVAILSNTDFNSAVSTTIRQIRPNKTYFKNGIVVGAGNITITKNGVGGVSNINWKLPPGDVDLNDSTVVVALNGVGGVVTINSVSSGAITDISITSIGLNYVNPIIKQKSIGTANIKFALTETGTIVKNKKNTITNISWAADEVTITTSVAHGYTVGDKIVISDSIVTAYNGTWTTIAGTTGSTIKFTLVAGADPGTVTSAVLSGWEIIDGGAGYSASSTLDIMEQFGTGFQANVILKRGAISAFTVTNYGQFRELTTPGSKKYTVHYQPTELNVTNCTASSDATYTYISSTNNFNNLNIGPGYAAYYGGKKIGIVASVSTNGLTITMSKKLLSLPPAGTTYTFKSEGKDLDLSLFYKPSKVDILNQGYFYSNYTLQPTNGHGSGAKLSTLVKDGIINTLYVGQPGTGYTKGEVYIDSNTGRGFHGVATVSAGAVTGVTVKSKGVDYNIPTISVAGGGAGYNIFPIINRQTGAISDLKIISGGTGFPVSSSQTITVGVLWTTSTVIKYNQQVYYGGNVYRAETDGITGDDPPDWTGSTSYSDKGTSSNSGVIWKYCGSKATATATINGSGVISSITVNTGGGGYNYANPYIIGNSGATGAAIYISSIYNKSIADITIQNPGVGYHDDCIISLTSSSTPTIEAVISTTIVDGSLQNVTLINGGSGYDYNTTAQLSYIETTTDIDANHVFKGVDKNLIDDGIDYDYNGATSSSQVNTGYSEVFPSKSMGAVNFMIPIVDFIDFWPETIGVPKDARYRVVSEDFGKISSVETLSGGKGYYSVDERTPLTLSVNGAGTGATLGAPVISTGAITSIPVTNGGQNYTSAPTVTITGTGTITSVATAHAVLKKYVNRIDILNNGYSWNHKPQINIGEGLSGDTATATVNMTLLDDEISSVLVTYAGYGYSGSLPTISFSGGGGTPPTAHAIIVNGNVTSIVVDNIGTNYTSYPSVSIAAPTIALWNIGDSFVLGNFVKNGSNNVYKATTTISSGGSEPVHTSGTVSNWLYLGPVSGATATAIALAPAVLDSITMINKGTYDTAPLVSLISVIGGLGGGAILEAKVNGKVNNIVIDSAGAGYATATATLVNDSTGGNGALLQPVLENGEFVDVVVLDGGEDYQSATITINGGQISGTSAVLTPVIENGIITKVNIDNPGTGYFYGTSALVIGDGIDATVEMDVNTGITGFEIIESADYYTSLPQIDITDDPPSGMTPGYGAILHPVIENNKIVDFQIINPGKNYHNPKIELSHVGDNKIRLIEVTNGGSGYSAPPTVTISGGGGASAVAKIQNGIVYRIIVTNKGENYTSVPSVTIAPPVSGVTATAEAKLSNTNIKLYADRIISGVRVAIPGKNYTNAALLVVGDGYGAKFNVNISKDSLKEISVDYKGNRYTSVPKLTITDESEYGAISKVKIVNPGKNYSQAPALTIDPVGRVYTGPSADPVPAGAEIVAYGKDIGKVKSVRIDEFGINNEHALIRFPLSIIVSENALYKENELLYVKGWDYDNDDYTTGPHGYVSSIDYDRNLIKVRDATDSYTILCENGDKVIMETYLQNSTLVHENSFNIKMGDILVGSITGNETKIVKMNRASGYSKLAGQFKYPMKIKSTTSAANDPTKRMHNNLRYQEYSYVMRTGLDINDYKSYVEALVHPAGYAPYGDVVIRTNLQTGISLPINERTGFNSYEITVLKITLLTVFLEKTFNQQWRLDNFRVEDYSDNSIQLTETDVNDGISTNNSWLTEVKCISEVMNGTYSTAITDINTTIVYNNHGLVNNDLVRLTFGGNGSGFIGAIQLGAQYSENEGKITGISITSGGTGYKSGFAYLTFTDPNKTGSGATATLTINGSGTITNITMTNMGDNYSSGSSFTLHTIGQKSGLYFVKNTNTNDFVVDANFKKTFTIVDHTTEISGNNIKISAGSIDHGLQTNDVVKYEALVNIPNGFNDIATPAAVAIGGLTSGNIYYVIRTNSTQIKLSATNGGTEITLNTTGMNGYTKHIFRKTNGVISGTVKIEKIEYRTLGNDLISSWKPSIQYSMNRMVQFNGDNLYYSKYGHTSSASNDPSDNMNYQTWNSTDMLSNYSTTKWLNSRILPYYNYENDYYS